MDELLKRGNELAGAAAAGQGLLSVCDAERGIESLRTFSVAEVGSTEWMDQREWIDKLNLQAHYNAQNYTDEFVVDLMVSHSKVATLIHEVLTIEVWRHKVYPRLKKHLAEAVDSVTSYYVIYHEATLANLLEVSLFDQHLFEDLEEDLLLELCDWCHRKLVYLNAEGRQASQPAEQKLEELLTINAVDELDRKCSEVEFATAISSLTILRYLCESITNGPMCIMSRLLCSSDIVMPLIALISDPPWVRNRKGKIEKFIHNSWRVVQPGEHLKLSQLDGQVWLSLCVLLVEPKCRAKYRLDDFRKDQILNLRRYFNEVLFDQLPVLKDLERVLDHITFGLGSDESHTSAGLILEQVPRYRANMLQGKDWDAIAKTQVLETFGKEGRKLGYQRMEEMLKCIDFMCNMHPDEVQPAVDTDKAACASIVTVEARRQIKNSTVWERTTEYSLELDKENPAEPVQLSAEKITVQGLRHKLKLQDEGKNNPLPAQGKVIVRFNGKSAEALAKLPAPPTKASFGDTPSTVWLTVGLLAKDGFVLQLKLKRQKEGLERNREGVWDVYRPVGGAITISQE